MHQHLSVKAAVGEVTDIGEFERARRHLEQRPRRRADRPRRICRNDRTMAAERQAAAAGLEPREQGT